MPEEIKLWHIAKGERLEACPPAHLDLEKRLETWIEQDISILSTDLLVIGRQVDTDFGGSIDLLCLNKDGDLVVVELKRDLTPRDVTAQALDYASWVNGLSNEQISAIAQRYLGEDILLEEAFARQFGSDLPDVLNESHSILIVGSQIDPSTERIIKYLSDTHGVAINAVTFQYFQTSDGESFLARVFLIEPEQIAYQTRQKGSSKRRRTLSYDELEGIADEKGAGELYRALIQRLTPFFKRHTTKSSVAFTGDFDGSQRAVFSLIPQKSTPEMGVHFQVYAQRLCRMFNLDEAGLLSLLPAHREPWIYYESAGPDYAGFAGYFATMEDIERFVAGLRMATGRRSVP